MAGLMQLGVNTANQAMKGMVRMGGLASAREMAGKQLKLKADIAEVRSQEETYQSTLNMAIAAISFGIGGGFSGGEKPTSLPEVSEGRVGPMQSDIAQSAVEAGGGEMI
jgi:hypothetical protein